MLHKGRAATQHDDWKDCSKMEVWLQAEQFRGCTKQWVMVPNSGTSSQKLLKHTHHKHLHCTICNMQSHAANPDPWQSLDFLQSAA